MFPGFEDQSTIRIPFDAFASDSDRSEYLHELEGRDLSATLKPTQQPEQSRPA